MSSADASQPRPEPRRTAAARKPRLDIMQQWAWVYAVLFFLVLQLQTVSGYGALQAGLATLPITILMLFLASRGGALGQRIGPRIPMTVGPVVIGLGTLIHVPLEANQAAGLPQFHAKSEPSTTAPCA